MSAPPAQSQLITSSSVVISSTSTRPHTRCTERAWLLAMACRPSDRRSSAYVRTISISSSAVGLSSPVTLRMCASSSSLTARTLRSLFCRLHPVWLGNLDYRLQRVAAWIVVVQVPEVPGAVEKVAYCHLV